MSCGLTKRPGRAGFVLLSLIMLLVAAGTSMAGQPIIGAPARVHVQEAALDFVARTDTGARTTSIHATDLKIKDAAEEKRQNVGKTATFTVTNGEGQSKTLSLPIAAVTRVRNAQGGEYRYQVTMHLRWKGMEKKLLVNLRDRSRMTYKLLLGRDFLSGILVDVDKDK